MIYIAIIGHKRYGKDCGKSIPAFGGGHYLVIAPHISIPGVGQFIANGLGC